MINQEENEIEAVPEIWNGEDEDMLDNALLESFSVSDMFIDWDEEEYRLNFGENEMDLLRRCLPNISEKIKK